MTEKDIAISIIMPVHNAGSTIGRALSSIASQRFLSFELLIINDGSTDDSKKIIQSLIAENEVLRERVNVTEFPDSKGVEVARRYGLEAASGVFIAHCDADDYVDPDWLGNLYNEATAFDADLTIAPYIAELPVGKSKIVYPDHISDGLNSMTINTVNFSLWNKLIRREFIIRNNISYLPGVECWEDLGLLTQIYALTPRIKVIDSASYHYFDNPKGTNLSRSGKDKLLRDHLRMSDNISDWMNQHNLSQHYKPFIDYLKYISKIKYLRGKNKNVKKWLATYPETNTSIMRMRRVPISVRFMTKAITMLPDILTQKIADICDNFYS